MSTENLHEGGCLCGGVRYRTTGDPKRVGVCHCRYCQLRTGSALGISVYFDSKNVAVLQGTLKSYSYLTESGNRFEVQFCENCGSTVFWTGTAESITGMTGIGGGSFDPPTFWYEIQREVFCRSKAPFLETNLAEQHNTISYYNPTHPEDARLLGND